MATGWVANQFDFYKLSQMTSDILATELYSNRQVLDRLQKLGAPIVYEKKQQKYINAIEKELKARGYWAWAE